MKSYSSKFDSSFKIYFLLPKYWGAWFLLGFLFVLSFCPIRVRDRFATWIADKIYNAKFLNKRKNIAFTNLSLCFSDYSQAEQKQLMRDNLRSLCQITLSLGELAFRDRDFLLQRVNLIGEQHIKNAELQNKAIIFLTPHCYGIDYASIAGINANAYPLSGMFKNYRNPVYDWFVTSYRTRFIYLTNKGALYHRKEGLKPIIKGLRDKTHFFYLPDEDHGRKKSVFTPFYDTQKATLPVLGRLTKLGQAIILPTYVSYNEKTAKYDIIFKEPLENIPSGDELKDTELMNKVIEKLIDENRSQYMWTLKLLKTRPDEGEKIY